MKYPLKKIIADLRNYRFLRKTIKTNMITPQWEKFNLRVDWIGRIYTVINLPPEIIHSPDSPESIRPAYVLEESRPLNEYLTSLNLGEIIIPEIRPIEGSVSYLLLYNPYFQKLSWKWIFKWIAIILVLIWLQSKFSAISWVFEIMKKIYGFIF